MNLRILAFARDEVRGEKSVFQATKRYFGNEKD